MRLAFLLVATLTWSRAGTLRDPDPPTAPRPLRRLKQLTGRLGWPDESTQCGITHDDGYGWTIEDLADPSPPQALADGSIRVTGTGWGSLQWPSWASFLRGEQPQWVHHDYALPGGDRMNSDEYPWDATIENDILYGGAMTSRFFDPSWYHARFSADDSRSDARTRRVYPFFRDALGRWLRASESIFGPTDNDSWIGHNYGHQFLTDENGQQWVFYERVDDNSINGLPNRTELFVSRMLDPFHADPQGKRIVTVERSPASFYPSTFYPSTNRGVDQLSEGPRPIRIGNSYVVGYSSGPWNSASYTMNFAASTNIDGPYRPQLTADGSDLEDVGLPLKERYGMTWGPGRPALFYDPDGGLWMLFHAKDAQTPCGFRNIYLAPAEIEMGPDALPRIHLGGAYAAPFHTRDMLNIPVAATGTGHYGNGNGRVNSAAAAFNQDQPETRP
ncbi:MAG TPA: hypothetical protein VN519_00595 [Bryobacteraceae bacterium]|nr:hypothetical protein [Bryobacteraceae bacterium]